MNAFCMRFETLDGENLIKKRAKNGIFVSNFLFGKRLQNQCKNHACILRHLQKTALNKGAKNVVFVSNFYFIKCLQNTGENQF